MLEIDDLTVRMGARVLLDQASVRLAEGWKVGLVGRNGTGKSTLLGLIADDAEAAAGAVRLKPGARIGHVRQEIEADDTPLIAKVLAGDRVRAALMDELETCADPDRIADIHTRLSDIDAWSAEARASAILSGLGFSADALERPSRAFSGGWRMRAALAATLFTTPDLLLLDEPTNYLDLEGAAWLESFLARYPASVLLVSHDRALLNRSVTHILALDGGKLDLYAGSYDQYVRRKAERLAQLSGQKARQDAERARIQSFVDRFRAKASKARQAQSRIKALERMGDIPLPDSGPNAPAFSFETPQDAQGAPLIRLEAADIGYAAGRPVLSGVEMRLDPEDRVALVGANGEGKTTLVKALAGLLPLMAGRRVASGRLRVGWFSQDQLDTLRADETVLDHVRALEPQAPASRWRSLAAAMGFGADKVMTRAGQLSGGEKVRLLLGLIGHAKPHVLILDEPTGHLDIEARESLVRALSAYDGALVLITHDVWLAEACADRLWLVRDGRAAPWDGDLGAYRDLVLAAARARPAPVVVAETPRGPSPPAVVDAAPPAPPAPSPSPSTLRRRAEQAERDMEQWARRLADCDARLADPAFYAGGEGAKEAARLAGERVRLSEGLAEAEARWLAAMERLETGGLRRPGA